MPVIKTHATWDAAQRVGFILSNNNLTATSSGSMDCLVMSTVGHFAGKHFLHVESDGEFIIGLRHEGEPASRPLGEGMTISLSWDGQFDPGDTDAKVNLGAATAPLWGSGMNIAFDATAGKLWLQEASWIGGGDPSLGTAPTISNIPEGVWHLFVAVPSGSSVAEITLHPGLLVEGVYNTIAGPPPLGFRDGWYTARMQRGPETFLYDTFSAHSLFAHYAGEVGAHWWFKPQYAALGIQKLGSALVSHGYLHMPEEIYDPPYLLSSGRSSYDNMYVELRVIFQSHPEGLSMFDGGSFGIELVDADSPISPDPDFLSLRRVQLFLENSGLNGLAGSFSGVAPFWGFGGGVGPLPSLAFDTPHVIRVELTPAQAVLLVNGEIVAEGSFEGPHNTCMTAENMRVAISELGWQVQIDWIKAGVLYIPSDPEPTRPIFWTEVAGATETP